MYRSKDLCIMAIREAAATALSLSLSLTTEHAVSSSLNCYLCSTDRLDSQRSPCKWTKCCAGGQLSSCASTPRCESDIVCAPGISCVLPPLSCVRDTHPASLVGCVRTYVHIPPCTVTVVTG